MLAPCDSQRQGPLRAPCRLAGCRFTALQYLKRSVYTSIMNHHRQDRHDLVQAFVLHFNIA